MSTDAVGYKHVQNKKAARKCIVPIRGVGGLPVPCGDPVLKAARCKEHYTDWRHAREARRGSEAVNPARRAKKALGMSGRQVVRIRKDVRRTKKAFAAALSETRP